MRHAEALSNGDRTNDEADEVVGMLYDPSQEYEKTRYPQWIGTIWKALMEFRVSAAPVR